MGFHHNCWLEGPYQRSPPPTIQAKERRLGWPGEVGVDWGGDSIFLSVQEILDVASISSLKDGK